MNSEEYTWKIIPGFDGNYEISNNGIIRRAKDSHTTWKGRILSYRINKGGYKTAVLYNKGERKLCCVHYLVTLTFIGERPENKVVNHKDCNKLNNDFHNLEYITSLENIKHAIDNGRYLNITGHRNKNSKLTENDVLEIRKMRGDGVSLVEVANKFNISWHHVSVIARRKWWRHI